MHVFDIFWNLSFELRLKLNGMIAGDHVVFKCDERYDHCMAYAKR